MKKNGLVSKVKAGMVALGLSVLPAEEVDSGASYGVVIGIDSNRNVSAGGYVSSTDRAKSFYVRGGINLVLIGKDRGKFQFRVGGGYSVNDRIAPSVDLSLTPNSKNPYSIGASLGLNSVKKDKEKLDVNGEVEEESPLCIGGTWSEEGECECPEPYFPVSGLEGFSCTKED